MDVVFRCVDRRASSAVLTEGPPVSHGVALVFAWFASLFALLMRGVQTNSWQFAPQI